MCHEFVEEIYWVKKKKNMCQEGNFEEIISEREGLMDTGEKEKPGKAQELKVLRDTELQFHS